MIRRLACRLVPVLALLATMSAYAQYPAKPVKLIVPFAAGSATDALARTLAQHLADALHGIFVVENRAGANGLIAAELVAKSPPDGYILIVATNTTHSANPHLYKKPPYDSLADFTPIARLTSSQFLLVVHPSLPAQSLPELIGYARAHPGKLSYATTNSSSLVTAESLKARAALDITGVPYKSNPTAIGDLLEGRISMMFADLANSVPLARSGKLRPLAVAGAKRTKLMPDVPTVAEAAPRELAGFALNSWAGLLGPAGLPRDLIERLNAEVNRILAKPEVIERLGTFGYELVAMSPREFAEWIRSQSSTWAAAIKAAGIQPE